MSPVVPWLQPVIERMAAHYQQGRLPHALLLHGAKGLGANDFARGVSQLLLCQQPEQATPCGRCQACALFAAQSHPDFHVIESEGALGVDEVRQAIEKLHQTAQLSGAKIFVIHNAHKMTVSASNALLKTLEEPTANTFILLVTPSISSLLPTILSRCSRWVLPAPDESTSRQWLEDNNIEIPDGLFDVYAKAPLTLLSVLDEDGAQQFATFQEHLMALTRGTLSPLVMANQWQDKPEMALQWLQHQVRHDKNAALQLHQSVVEARRALTATGVNKSLILNSVFQQFAQIK